jgi:hypothetical protein
VEDGRRVHGRRVCDVAREGGEGGYSCNTSCLSAAGSNGAVLVDGVVDGDEGSQQWRQAYDGLESVRLLRATRSQVTEQLRNIMTLLQEEQDENRDPEEVDEVRCSMERDAQQRGCVGGDGEVALSLQKGVQSQSQVRSKGGGSLQSPTVERVKRHIRELDRKASPADRRASPVPIGSPKKGHTEVCNCSETPTNPCLARIFTRTVGQELIL